MKWVLFTRVCFPATCAVRVITARRRADSESTSVRSVTPSSRSSLSFSKTTPTIPTTSTAATAGQCSTEQFSTFVSIFSKKSQVLCVVYSKELTADARELKGELYCLPCHDKMGVPICGACRRPIEGRVVNAMGKQWHVEVRVSALQTVWLTEIKVFFLHIWFFCVSVSERSCWKHFYSTLIVLLWCL